MTSIHEEVQIAIHGIWSRRWLALAVAWAIALPGWLVVSLIPNSYESRARVYIEAQSILSPAPGASPVDQQQSLDQIRQTLTSVDNLVQVVKGTDLGKTARNDSDIGGKVGTLKTGITIISQQNNLFEIAARSADRSLSDRQNARVSQQIVNTLLAILRRENMTGGKATTSETLRILDGQIQARAKDLAAAERRRVDFEQKNIGLLPGAGSIGSRIDQTRGELSQIDSQIVSARSELAGINGQLASTPQTIDTAGGGGTPGVSPLGQAMGELAQAHARGWTDSHPDVVALKRQIAALRAAGSGSGNGGGSLTRTPNPAYMQLRSLQAERSASVAALQARRADLAGQMGGMATRQAQEPGVAAEQASLNRDYDTMKAQYDKLVADREEARLRGDVESEAGIFRVRLIDPPGLPGAPASPNRPLLLVGVLIAAIGAGVGIAFVLGQVQTTYATAGRLERATGIPVLGAITDSPGAAAIARRRRMLGIFAGAGAGLFVMCLMLVVLEFVQRGMAA